MEADVEERRDENSLDSPKEQRGTDQESQEKPEKVILQQSHLLCKGCFFINGLHKLFYVKPLTTFDFLLNAKTARFFTIFPIFLELPLII